MQSEGTSEDRPAHISPYDHVYNPRGMPRSVSMFNLDTTGIQSAAMVPIKFIYNNGYNDLTLDLRYIVYICIFLR